MDSVYVLSHSKDSVKGEGALGALNSCNID